MNTVYIMEKGVVYAMDKKLIGKFVMMGLGTALTLAASLVQSKNQDIQIKEAVANEVAEALKNQTKGS